MRLPPSLLGLSLALSLACARPEAGADSAVGHSTEANTSSAPTKVYVLDLRPNYLDCAAGCQGGVHGRSQQQLLDDHDLMMLAVSIQGVVNRQAPQLYLYATEADFFWLKQAMDGTKPWGWAAGATVIPLQGITDLLQTFGPQLSGSVRWTADVPAGLNVATTSAGIDGLAVVRQGSTFESQVTAELPVKLDLVGKFSSKLGAATYARTNYLSRTRHGLLGYQLDGWPWRLLLNGSTPHGGACLFARDYLIAEQGYFFDLSPWWDEAPNDDPGQPKGADRQELLTILAAAKSAVGPDGLTSLWGFYPWADKYSLGSTLHPNAVSGEWETARLFSEHDARITGGGGQAYGKEIANTSFHRWGSFPRHAPRNRTPTPSELTDLGYLNQHLLNPGFEWGNTSAWNIDAPNRAVYKDATTAAAGAYYLETNSSAVGQSLYQDVSLAGDVGAVFRLRVSYRLHGNGTAKLVLWATGSATPTPAQTTLDQTDGAWHSAEVTLGPLNQASSGLRAQVYLDTPALNCDFDEFRLARLAPADDSVAALTYVSVYLGDYDNGTTPYTFPTSTYPFIWNDSSRGKTPVGWGMAPDTIEYLPGVMAYYYGTRGASDFFTATDSGAGYVNPSFMTTAGANAFVRYSRQSMGRMGESFLSFFLNGLAGIPDLATQQRWNGIGPDGVMVNWMQLGNPTRRLVGNVGWGELEQNWSFAGISTPDAVNNVNADYAARYPGAAPGAGPRFLYGRSVYTGPDLTLAMISGAQGGYPDRDYTLVDPYTFGFLLRRSLGGNNNHRASWLADTLPRAALASPRLQGTVTVRNDGWDTWTDGACQLGLVVGSQADATPMAPLGETVATAALPHAVSPGATIDVPIATAAPSAAGDTLSYDIQCSGVWLESAGNIPYRDALTQQPEADAGTVATDGGTSDTDGGTPDTDAGAPDADGGTPGSDAGTPGPGAVPSSCGCRSDGGGGPLTFWILIGVSLVGVRLLRASRGGVRASGEAPR